MRAKKEEVPLPEGLVLNTNIAYYLDGWRVGRLDGFKGGKGIVTPNPAYKAAEGNHITVLPEDMKPLK